MPPGFFDVPPGYIDVSFPDGILYSLHLVDGIDVSTGIQRYRADSSEADPSKKTDIEFK